MTGPDSYLFHQNGKSLVLEGFGKLNVLRSLVVNGQRGYDHVGQAAQQLSHHAVPLLLVTVVHLHSANKTRSSNRQTNAALAGYPTELPANIEH